MKDWPWAGHYPNEYVTRAEIDKLIEGWQPERWRKATNMEDTI